MSGDVDSDAISNLASAVVMAILATFNDRVVFLQTLHITINGVLELRLKERVPHVGVKSLSTADSMHFGHEITPFAFKKRSCQIFASSGEIAGSVSPPRPGVPGTTASPMSPARVRGHLGK